MMLSRDVAKATITVYTYLPDRNAFHRAVIRDCAWLQGSQTKMGRHGMSVPGDVEIRIPWNHRYVSAQNGTAPRGHEWTVRMGPELEGSYIVKGECPFHAPRGVVAADFPQDVVIPFERKYGPKRPKEVSELFYGSRNMWYLEVNC